MKAKLHHSRTCLLRRAHHSTIKYTVLIGNNELMAYLKVTSLYSGLSTVDFRLLTY
jgi:hypothetical protein